MIKPNYSIQIRDWKETDFEVYKYWHFGSFEWMKFNGPYYPVKTMQELESEIRSLQLPYEALPKKRYVIADLETDQLIGTVSWYWQSEATNWLSIGIAIYDERHWGKGIGYQALGLWCQFLFDNIDFIVRLDLRTWSGHKGMMKLAEKLHFKQEARFRKARIANGEFFDSIGYGILREEWNRHFPKGIAG